MKGQSFLERVLHAIAGLTEAWRRERSVRTQVLMALAAILVTAVVRPGAVWWAILALTIGLVFVTEMINTSIETLIDHLHPAIHPAIKVAKDMAAGSVLLASIAAVAVGLCLVIAAIQR